MSVTGVGSEAHNAEQGVEMMPTTASNEKASEVPEVQVPTVEVVKTTPEATKDAEKPTKEATGASGSAFPWLTGLATVAVVAAATYESNPGRSEEHFKQFLRNQWPPVTHRVAESLGLVSTEYFDLGVAAVGREGSRVFVGILDQWHSFELPSDLTAVQAQLTDGLTSLSKFPREPLFGGDADSFAAHASFLLFALLTLMPLLSVAFKACTFPSLQRLLLTLLCLHDIGPIARELLSRNDLFFVLVFGGCCATLGSRLLSAIKGKERPPSACFSVTWALVALLAYVKAAGGAGTPESRFAGPYGWREVAYLNLVFGGGNLEAHVIAGASGWMAAVFNLLQHFHEVAGLMVLTENALMCMNGLFFVLTARAIASSWEC